MARKNYNIATTPQEEGSKDWYKNCSNAIAEMREEGYDTALLDSLVIDHITESLQFEDALALLNEVYAVDSDSFVDKIKGYFTRLLMKADGITGIQMQHVGKQELVVLDKKTKKWNKAQPEDYISLQPEIAKMLSSYMPLSRKAGKYIGFMSSFKKEVYDIQVPRCLGRE
jgi:ribosomal protein S17E